MKLKKPVALIGLMGSGKTATGLLLSQKLKIPFCDTDDFIIAQEGMSVADIFATKGEAAFRIAEQNCLTLIDWRTPSVLSTGGGFFIASAIRDFLLEHAHVVWLNVPTSLLKQRLREETGHRPLLNNVDWEERLETLAKSREFAYQKAHWQCPVADESVEAVVEKIIAHLETL